MCFVWLSTLEIHIYRHIHINIILWWTRIINSSNYSVYFSFIENYFYFIFYIFYFPYIFSKQAPHRVQWFVFNKTADSRLISKFIVAFTKCTTRRISIFFSVFFCYCCCWLMLLGKMCMYFRKKQKKKKEKLREFIFRKICSVLFHECIWNLRCVDLFYLVGCWTLILQAQCDRFRPKLLWK